MTAKCKIKIFLSFKFSSLDRLHPIQVKTCILFLPSRAVKPEATKRVQNRLPRVPKGVIRSITPDMP